MAVKYKSRKSKRADGRGITKRVEAPLPMWEPSMTFVPIPAGAFAGSFAAKLEELGKATESAIEGLVKAFDGMSEVAREAVINITGHVALGCVKLNEANQFRVATLVGHPKVGDEPLVYGVSGKYVPGDLVVFYVMDESANIVSALQKARVHGVTDANSFVEKFKERLAYEAGGDFELANFVRTQVDLGEPKRFEWREESGIWL